MGKSFSARVETFLEEWMTVLAACWLVSAFLFAIIRVCWAVWNDGFIHFVTTVKLNDAGDFVAGVIAVPAFIYLVRGFLTQQKELSASVEALKAQELQMKAQADALISQGRILDRQLELAEAARLVATEPRFVLRRFVYARGQEYADDEIEDHADANWLVELRCEQHDVYDVEMNITPADERVVIEDLPVRQSHLPVAGTLGRQLIRPQPHFPCELLFFVRYRRKDLTEGEQRHWMYRDGQANRLYPEA